MPLILLHFVWFDQLSTFENKRFEHHSITIWHQSFPSREFRVLCFTLHRRRVTHVRVLLLPQLASGEGNKTRNRWRDRLTFQLSIEIEEGSSAPFRSVKLQRGNTSRAIVWYHCRTRYFCRGLSSLSRKFFQNKIERKKISKNITRNVLWREIGRS